MNAEGIVRTRLLAIPALTALVEDRIYALILPQNCPMPAVRVQGIDRDDPVHLRGPVGWVSARVQVDHYAYRTTNGDGLWTAQQCAAAAHGDFSAGTASGLAGWSGWIGSPPVRVDLVKLLDEREEYQAAELDELRIMQDYLVHWRETGA